MESRACLDALQAREFSCFSRESNHDFSVFQPVAYSLFLSVCFLFFCSCYKKKKTGILFVLQCSLYNLVYEQKSLEFVFAALFYQEYRDPANTCDDSKPICISFRGGSLYESRFWSLFTLDESEMAAEPTAANTVLVFLLIRFML